MQGGNRRVNSRLAILVVCMSFLFLQVDTKVTLSLNQLQNIPCSMWWRYICVNCSENPSPNLDPCSNPSLALDILDVDSLVTLCVSQIMKGQFKESVKTFHKIGNDSALESIVQRVYAEDKEANLIKLMRFADNDLFPNQQNMIYENLYWKMYTSFINPSFLVLASRWNGENLDFNQMLIYRYQVQYVQDYWAKVIQNPDLEPNQGAVKQIQQYLSTHCETYLDAFWPSIIEHALHKNVSNIETILGFTAGKLHEWKCRYAPNGKIVEFEESRICVTHKVSIMEALRKQTMEHGYISTKEFIQVAYSLKMQMDKLNTSTVEDDIFNHASRRHQDMRPTGLRLYGGIKNKFPLQIQKLIWEGSNCQIVSALYSGYLYADLTKFSGLDKETGGVFTSISKQPPSRKHWKVESNDYGKTFRVQNVNLNKNLCGSIRNGTWDVFYGEPETHILEEKWIIEPSAGGQMFYMKSSSSGSYLGATTNKVDANRRNVVTSTRKHYWKIEC